MQPTKRLFLVLSTGALLCAGLYYFLGREVAKSPSIIKPSQLDFSQSNQLQEPQENPVPESTAEASATTQGLPLTEFSELSVPEQRLWLIFEEVLLSKNDSDARINELRPLSATFRKALINKYQQLKAEDRNGRGFVVFLIGRELSSSADLEFMQSIYQESPCLSLENCAQSSQDEGAHGANVGQTTLIYPQLVGLYQIEKQLEARPGILQDPGLRSGLLVTLRQAEAFPVPAVQERAAKIRKKYNL